MLNWWLGLAEIGVDGSSFRPLGVLVGRVLVFILAVTVTTEINFS